MKKIYLMFVFLFGLVALTALASATPLTVVSGTITEANSSVVDGATVTVTCEHSGINTTKIVTSGSDGKYYAFYPAMNCDAGDNVWVHADKGGSVGSNDGTVSYSRQCKINTSLIDVQIPEFGVIAGGVALIGAIAGFVIMRKRED